MANLGNTGVVPAAMRPIGYRQITSLSSAVGLNAPQLAQIALIQAEGQDVRWRDDGTAPTATVGMVIANGATLAYTGDLASIQLIESIASATLNISYYG